jgi:Ca2+-transporting ATPase
MITAGCLGLGYYFMQHNADVATVRTIIFTTLLFSNIFLTLVNRSFQYSVATTLRYKNYMVTIVILITLAFILSLLFIPFIRALFLLQTISLNSLIKCLIVAFISTMWIEFFKTKSKKVQT